jgi:hypothetical protein
MQKITYLMHTLCIPCINFMHTMCRVLCTLCVKLVTWAVPIRPSHSFNEFSRCSLLTTTCEKPARMVGGPQDPFCDCRFWGRWCTILHMAQWGGQPDLPVDRAVPKRRVGRAVLGDRQRCSPLTRTYVKAAGMVWGPWDHFCDIRFLSVHMKFALAATSGARFCGELVGARKDALHSNFRYRWFRVRPQRLPSLGAFGGMVLVRHSRQSGTFRMFQQCFLQPSFFAVPWRKLTGSCENVVLESSDFGQDLEVCRVWVQSGLWCLRGGRAKMGRTGVLLHQVCKVCTKSANIWGRLSVCTPGAD